MAGKAEIVDSIASDAGMTRASATQALDAVVNYLQQALKKGERVGVPGLGIFSVADRKARAGINPQTKEPIRIAAAKAVRFRPGKDLKELLNKKKK
jgi:DNA-binding protein HU-beta